MKTSGTLPLAAASAGAARRMVREALTGASSEVCEAVTLMTSELVTNVVRHANTAVKVDIDTGPPIRVEVHNHLAATEAFRMMVASRPGFEAIYDGGGRGLTLVHDLASRIGLNDDPQGGKAVWFEVDAPESICGDSVEVVAT
jgi:anti-sigma regulatory factor (Ser/Thr protein kinase)